MGGIDTGAEGSVPSIEVGSGVGSSTAFTVVAAACPEHVEGVSAASSRIATGTAGIGFGASMGAGGAEGC
jgi:hypothetical protein